MSGRQAGAHVPLGEGSNLAAGTHLPSWKGSSLSQAGSQASQAVTSQPGAHLLPGEGSSLSQAGGQASKAGTHLPSGEGSSLVASQAGSQASQASQVADRLVTASSLEEGGSLVVTPVPRQVLAFPLLGETLSKQVTTSPQVRQGVKLLGQAVNIPGVQPGKGPPRLQRETALPPRQTVLVPGMAIPHLTPHRLPKGSSPEDSNHKWVINLSRKPLTPAQRSVLAKGPNFPVYNCYRSSLYQTKSAGCRRT